MNETIPPLGARVRHREKLRSHEIHSAQRNHSFQSSQHTLIWGDNSLEKVILYLLGIHYVLAGSHKHNAPF